MTNNTLLNRKGWTDERIDLLRKLWAEGFSALECARELGGISRNAVIGKVHRLKLASRSPRASEFKAPGAPSPAKGSVKRKYARRQFIATAEDGNVVRLIDDMPPAPTNEKIFEPKRGYCHFPIGEIKDHDFGYCGAPSMKDGKVSTYCPYHSRIMYQPVSERRRAARERAKNSKMNGIYNFAGRGRINAANDFNF